MDVIPAIVARHRSVFVVGTRAAAFWAKKMNAYPFRQGVLLSATTDDESRYPALFLFSDNGVFRVSETAPEWFDGVWEEHLMGLYESGLPIPTFAFAPELVECRC